MKSMILSRTSLMTSVVLTAACQNSPTKTGDDGKQGASEGVAAAISDTSVDEPAAGLSALPASALKAPPTHDVDRARARSFITFWEFKDVPTSAALVERTDEREDRAASVSLNYLSRIDDRQLVISLTGNATAKTLELPRQGSLTVAKSGGEVWEAVSGTIVIEESGGQRILHLTDIVLKSEGAAPLEPKSGSVRGELARECYVLPERDDAPQALNANANGAVGKLTATRFDPQWLSPFCAQQK